MVFLTNEKRVIYSRVRIKPSREPPPRIERLSVTLPNTHTLDFEETNKIAAEIAEIPSKRLRNKIASISFKLHGGGARERKDQYVPERFPLLIFLTLRGIGGG
ncbi:hypothetical protein BON22_5261 [Cyberlindnera fabianii]|uniref:Uncharacterized protein n=1 Tax=Cyberlindnera fabianii TaxID=36022 RepID=A0A1V2L1F1_CYBFA|nr:hypothetical protein BON22_5261 [Cyberlindnera fabianii]